MTVPPNGGRPRRDDDPESADAVSATVGWRQAAGSVPGADPEAEARALLAGTLARRHHRQWLGSRRRQVVAAVIIIGAIGFIAFQGLTNATEYFVTTKQAVADRASLGTKAFRIEGTVANDVRQVGQTTRFVIYADSVCVPIVSTGSPPELFKPGVPVVLEGHWQGNIYASDQIMVKHTASYTEAHPGRVEDQLPATPPACVRS